MAYTPSVYGLELLLMESGLSWSPSPHPALQKSALLPSGEIWISSTHRFQPPEVIPPQPQTDGSRSLGRRRLRTPTITNLRKSS